VGALRDAKQWLYGRQWFIKRQFRFFWHVLQNWHRAYEVLYADDAYREQCSKLAEELDLVWPSGAPRRHMGLREALVGLGMAMLSDLGVGTRI
jgi:hypothetical protein